MKLDMFYSSIGISELHLVFFLSDDSTAKTAL
jgi:hypothetical protein